VAFLAPGDLLVLPRVSGLPKAYGGLERLLRELDARGAAALFVAEALRTDGEDGRHLRHAVAAVAALRPRRPPRPTANLRAKALALQAAGARPGEIARRLGVSRMTVWRWLKAPA
jgi:DNA invertase Pin-like site-specific DNA recombinase